MKFKRVGNRLIAQDEDSLQEMVDSATTTGDLARIWRRQPDCFVRPLTGEQRGKIKHLVAACGDDISLAAQALAIVITDWPKFSSRVMKATGKAIVPKQPHLGFVLANADEAVRLVMAKTEEPEVHARAPEARSTTQVKYKKTTREQREAYLRKLREAEDG